MGSSSNNNALKTLTAILTFLLLGLGIYTIKFYNEVKDNEIALIDEKELIEGELKEILDKYNEQSENSDLLSDELKIAKNRIQGLLDTLKTSKITQAVLQNYRMEIRELRNQRDFLLKKADSLSIANKNLIAQNTSTVEAFGASLIQRDSLQRENTELHEEIKKGAEITISNFIPNGVILRRSGKLLNNDRAKRIDKIEICYTVNENPLARSGMHKLYIQIIDPLNNVIGDRVTLDFGENNLTYSELDQMDYKNEESKNCLLVDPYGEDFVEGLYKVNIFEEDRLLSTAVLTLN